MLVKSEISSQNFHSCFFFDLSFRLSYLFLKLQRFCMISDIMLDFLINRLCSSLLISIRTDLWYCNPFSVYFLDLLQSPQLHLQVCFPLAGDFLSDQQPHLHLCWWNHPHIYPILHWLTSFWSNLLSYPPSTTCCNCLTKGVQLNILEQQILLYWS